ncbi:MAG: alpha/beta hydrolase [Patescibacteria group bacterium]|nr:alpha/beta hydrolase [Patescibacteria group bacterium]
METFPNSLKSEKNTIEQWFEEEFKKRETLNVSGEQIEILDIAPKELKQGAPVLFISGYGDGSPEGRKTNILELVKQGRRVIAVKSPHGIDQKSDNPKTENLRDSILKQVNAINLVLEKKGVGKVSVIGESRGGIVTLAAAHLYPDKFENLVLVDSGGLVKEINTALLGIRFLNTGISEGKTFKEREKAGLVSALGKEQVEWGTKEFMKWVLKTPILSTKEINDIAKSETYQFLREIKNHGIGISIVHGVDDKVFPMKDVQKNISEQKKSGNPEELQISEIIDGFYSVEGGHGDLNTKPEQYTSAAEKVLTALENKQRSIKNSEVKN